jgi:uncharacterized protein YdeI (YjbR/CyaY-like superfamily)
MGLKNKILMNCESATALVEKKRDRKLDLSERLGLWMHLAYCSFCTLFFEQSKILDDTTKVYSERVTNQQKSYKLNPDRKSEIIKAFDTELKKEH